MKSNKARKTYVRTFFISATIITVLVLHFAVSQFFLLEENAQDFFVNELTVEQPVIMKPENKAEKAEMVNKVNTTDAVPQPVRTERKIEARREVERETETVNRKKAPRETRAERLRRVERILTGI